MNVLVQNLEGLDTTSLREFIGFIWVDDNPGIRLQVWATSVTVAEELVIERYGSGHIVSIWNEEDAHKLR